MGAASGSFEIPSEFRALTQKGIEQAFKSYEGFRDLAKETAQCFEGSAESWQAGMVDANRKAITAFDESIEESFELASELAKATSLQDAMALQSKYVQSQVKRFGDVAMEMGTFANKVAEEALKGAK